MELTIIGTGNMARGIASRLLAGGHAVTLLGTERQKAEKLAAELPADASAGESGDPLSGEMVVLAVWYASLQDVLSQYRDQLAGKIVVDITNPLDVEAFEPLAVEAGSAAQEIAASAPDARVVKAFNTTFAGTLAEGTVAGQPLDVFLASDDDDAKATVAQLVRDGGLRPVDVGPLRRARELEAMGYLHMVVQQPLDTGFGSALRVVS